VPPGAGGTLELVADGDFSFPTETATATAEGTAVGSVGGIGLDCVPATGVFTLSAARLAELAADGVMSVDVQNSFDVDVFCDVNRHTVRLRYGTSAERVDFGSLFVGLSRELTLTVRNLGSAPLEVTGIGSDRGEFTVGTAGLSIGPRGTGSVAVTFRPGSAGTFTGTLRLASNDPDQPVAELALRGVGVPPPDIALAPTALAEDLMVGRSSTRVLRIANDGGAPLTAELSVGEPGWLSVSPASVTIDANGTAPVDVAFDATALPVGSHDTELVVRSNDPDETPLAVPVNLQVADVEGTVVVSPSTLNLGRRGQWVTAYLELPPAYDLAGVALSTLRLNRASPADPSTHTLGDVDQDGIPDLTLKFDLDRLRPTLDEGNPVTVVLTGELEGGHRLLARASIRVTRHKVTSPNGGEVLAPGAASRIRWSGAGGEAAQRADLDLSINDGVTWSRLAANVGGSSFEWVVPDVVSRTARIRVVLSDADGAIDQDSSDQPFSILRGPTDVATPATDGADYRLRSTPNPSRVFGPTIIGFTLPRAAAARVAVYDAAGHLVRVVADGRMDAGRHEVVWQGVDRLGRPVASGVYFCELREGAVRLTRRMVVLR
jgi:hypothetical protein